MKKFDSGDRSKMFYWQGDRPFTEQEVKEVFLDRHSKFDRDLAQKCIEYGIKKAGIDAKVVEVSDPVNQGSVNSASYGTLDNGQKVLLRMHPIEARNGYFFSEALAAEAAKDVGVPSYSTYYIHEANDELNFDFQILEVVPGVAMKAIWPIDPKLDEKLVFQIGQYLAKVHNIETKKYGFFDNEIAKKEKRLEGYHDDWKKHIYAAFEENIKYLRNTNTLDSGKIQKVEKIFADFDHVIKCDSPRLVHNDLADWNVMIDPAKEIVTGFIDWDESFSGDPIMDFAQWSLFFDENRTKHLYDGYKTVSILPDNFEIKFHVYKVRYNIAKMALRVKKQSYQQNFNIAAMLEFAHKTLLEEFEYFKV